MPTDAHMRRCSEGSSSASSQSKERPRTRSAARSTAHRMSATATQVRPMATHSCRDVWGCVEGGVAVEPGWCTSRMGHKPCLTRGYAEMCASAAQSHTTSPTCQVNVSMKEKYLEGAACMRGSRGREPLARLARNQGRPCGYIGIWHPRSTAAPASAKPPRAGPGMLISIQAVRNARCCSWATAARLTSPALIMIL